MAFWRLVGLEMNNDLKIANDFFQCVFFCESDLFNYINSCKTTFS